MKKVLFATTALVMTAGVAAAEVSLSGDGRMGVVYDGDDVNFTSRARVTFTLSGETDGGLAFGGSFRADNATDAKVGSAGSVYISGAFGKVTMGDIDSGAENAMGDLPGVGLTGLGDHNEFMYPGSDGEKNDNPGLLYTYAGDNFNVYLSAYDGKATGFGLPAKVGPDANAISLGGNYTFSNFTVAAGYTKLDNDLAGVDDGQVWGLAGIAAFGDVKVTAAYAKGEDVRLDQDGSAGFFNRTAGNAGAFVSGEVTQYGIGAETTFGATTVSAFYRKVEADDNASVDAFEADYIGIGASYDLGGGAAIEGGIVKWDEEITGANPYSDDDIKADFGISFKF